VCHHGHQAHPDDRRRHQGDRRNRHRLRDGRRNRHQHRPLPRDDRERHRCEPDAHPGDRPQCFGRASCRGWDGAHRAAVRRHRREPGGHPAGEACPDWARTGCCRDEQPAASHGLRDARDPRGHFSACPGSGRTGCFQGVEHLDGGQDAGRQRHPHEPREPPGWVPWDQAPWLPGPWGTAPSGRVPSGTAPPAGRVPWAHRQQPGRGSRPREPGPGPGPGPQREPGPGMPPRREPGSAELRILR